MGRELGRRWGALDPAAKRPYEERAAAAKEKYQLALTAYTPAVSVQLPPPAVSGKLTKKERRESRDPSKPKRALSSFMLWCQAELEIIGLLFP
jgi:hypothetical protein